jgi:hypothetical protein
LYLRVLWRPADDEPGRIALYGGLPAAQSSPTDSM